jgi:chromosome partitioning protein
MRKISVINYKGGTGKTSTVVNMAHGMALGGKKVLIIDTDPQGSASHYLGIRTSVTLYDLLIKGLDPEDCIVNARENLDIICANEHLFPAEMKLAKEDDREYVLSDRLELLEGYDVVLIDCAPSMNLLNQNALIYSDEILLPVSMEYLSLIGVKQLLKNIKIINKLFDKEINITKVIPTFFDKRNKKSKDILDSLKRVFPGNISSPIRTCVSLSEAPGIKKTIFEYDPNSKASEDYMVLIKEVLSSGKEKRL